MEKGEFSFPFLNISNIRKCVFQEIIIPVQSQYLSAMGMGNLINIVSKIKKQINPELKVGGILLTLVDKRTKLSTRLSKK